MFLTYIGPLGRCAADVCRCGIHSIIVCPRADEIAGPISCRAWLPTRPGGQDLRDTTGHWRHAMGNSCPAPCSQPEWAGDGVVCTAYTGIAYPVLLDRATGMESDSKHCIWCGARPCCPRSH